MWGFALLRTCVEASEMTLWTVVVSFHVAELQTCAQTTLRWEKKHPAAIFGLSQRLRRAQDVATVRGIYFILLSL